MALEGMQAVQARIGEIQVRIAALGGGAGRSAATLSAGRRFDAVLSSTLQGIGSTTPTAVGGTPTGARMVQLARAELGQTEAPKGSNDSTRISQYRSATEWNPVGPWCAYFASWVAREAGVPLGERGQGFARVADVWSWGRSSGRALPTSANPAPGDLVIMDGHMGIVEAVLPNGKIQTLEGNKDDRVSRIARDRDELRGFVRMG